MDTSNTNTPAQIDLYRMLQNLPMPIWFAVLVGLCFFLLLGNVPLFDLDEGAFSAASFEMLQRHDFITTYLNGEPRFDKAILIYWLQVISVSLFGVNEWGFRLPSAIAASFWMWAILSYSQRFIDRQSAIAAVLFAAGSFMVVVIGRAAIADALLNLFIALTMLAIIDYTRRPDPVTLRWIFAWMGLGVLTKGPIALVIPVVVSFAWYAWNRDLKSWFATAFRPLPWLIFALIVLPWYVLEYLDQGQAFIDGFFLKHNINRFSSTMEGHGGRLYYYLPVLLFIFMPYTGMLAMLLIRLRRLLEDPLDRFLWLWFGFVLLFFSVSGTQLPHYLLYGATPLFILMAKYRHLLTCRLLAYIPALFFFGVLLFLPDIFRSIAGQSTDAYIQAMAQGIDAAMGTGYRLWIGAAVLLAALIPLFARSRLMPAQGLHVLALAQVLLMLFALFPAFGKLQQEPVRKAALRARTLAEPVVIWQLRMPSFSIYRGKVTPERRPVAGEVVFTRIDKLKGLKHYELLFSEGGIVLARVKSPSNHED